jgi:hypothetical protein
VIAKTFNYPGITPEELEQQCLDIVLHDEDWAEFYWLEIPGVLRLLYVMAYGERIEKYVATLPDDERERFLKLIAKGPTDDAGRNAVARQVIHDFVYPEQFIARHPEMFKEDDHET